MTIQSIIDQIVKHEGGFVNNPADPGGATNFGITAKTLGAARKLGRDATPEEVQAITQDMAWAIYYNMHYISPGFDRITHENVQYVLVDSCVQHGEANAVRLLQRALGVNDDGKLGPETLVTCQQWDGHKLALHIMAERCEFYGRMVSNNLTDRDKDGIPDNAEFNAGHMQRVSDILKAIA